MLHTLGWSSRMARPASRRSRSTELLSVASLGESTLIATSCPVATSRARYTTSRSEEHTSELQSHLNLVCRLLLEKKKKNSDKTVTSTQCAQSRRAYAALQLAP